MAAIKLTPGHKYILCTEKISTWTQHPRGGLGTPARATCSPALSGCQAKPRGSRWALDGLGEGWDGTWGLQRDSHVASLQPRLFGPTGTLSKSLK